MYSKNRQLIEKLYDKTTSGSLKWIESQRGTTYYLDLSANVITLKSRYVSVLGEMEPCHQISLKIEDKNGQEIDTVERLGLSDPNAAYKSDYNLMRSLYEVASRSARNLDTVIDNIIKELN